MPYRRACLTIRRTPDKIDKNTLQFSLRKVVEVEVLMFRKHIHTAIRVFLNSLFCIPPKLIVSVDTCGFYDVSFTLLIKVHKNKKVAD
jgi:hypothetical protein